MPPRDHGGGLAAGGAWSDVVWALAVAARSKQLRMAGRNLFAVMVRSVSKEIKSQVVFPLLGQE